MAARPGKTPWSFTPEDLELAGSQIDAQRQAARVRGLPISDSIQPGVYTGDQEFENAAKDFTYKAALQAAAGPERNRLLERGFRALPGFQDELSGYAQRYAAANAPATLAPAAATQTPSSGSSRVLGDMLVNRQDFAPGTWGPS